MSTTFDEHLRRRESHPVCRDCEREDPTVGPDGKCFDCWSPNPYGNEAYDEDDDREVEPPLDEDGPRGNGRIFL